MAYCCIVSRAPMRAQPSHRAEMVNELLLGETADALEIQQDFVLVRAHFDGYEGWVQGNQLWALAGPAPMATGYITRHSGTILLNDNLIPVPFGTPIFDKDAMPFDGSFGNLYLRNAAANAESIELGLQLWKVFDGAPYLWGGKTPWGTDCSGFVQQLYKLWGQTLPRDAWQQALLGETVDFLEAAQPGDLAFFDNAEGRITHVGLLLGNRSIVHASGNVHVDSIDTHGITHHLTGKRTHQLRVIKRLL